MRRVLAAGALVAFIAGCATANGPDQWAARYKKPGVTSQQLTEDGAACLGASPNPWVGTAVGVGGFGSGLVPPSGASRNIEMDSHAECMKERGYTVIP